MSVEGNGIEGGILQPSPLKVNFISDANIADVLSYLFFIFLIDKDKHVVFGVCGIVEHLVLSWMVSFVFITADGYMKRGGDALEKGGLGFYHFFIDIGLNEVGEG
jgi:hypothetical protein